MKVVSMRVVRSIALSVALWLLSLSLRAQAGAMASQAAANGAPVSVNLDALQKMAQKEGEAGQTSEAIRDYKRVLESRPEWKEGWWNLGALQYSANQFADAKSTLLHVVGFAPDLGSAWSLLGLCE